MQAEPRVPTPRSSPGPIVPLRGSLVPHFRGCRGAPAPDGWRRPPSDLPHGLAGGQAPPGCDDVLRRESDHLAERAVRRQAVWGEVHLRHRERDELALRDPSTPLATAASSAAQPASMAGDCAIVRAIIGSMPNFPLTASRTSSCPKI
jgi:hypothetical protein